PQKTLDPTRGAADVEFDAADAVCLESSERIPAIVRDVLDWARLGQAAEQVGGAARCLEIAVEHAKAREQFGRPIGSFQAVKHQCPEMRYDLEVARSATWYGAWAFDEAPDELPEVV